jgi:hypothetical protein
MKLGGALQMKSVNSTLDSCPIAIKDKLGKVFQLDSIKLNSAQPCIYLVSQSKFIGNAPFSSVKVSATKPINKTFNCNKLK